MSNNKINDWMNQVVNGDCLELMQRLPSNCIDLVVCDTPYGMSFESNYRNIKHKKIENDDSLEWLEDYIVEVKRLIKEDSHCYFFCSNHYIDVFVKTIKKHLPYKNILIWEKNNTGMGDLEGDYAPQYEFIIFCSNGKRKLNGRRDSNIIKGRRTGSKYHPTEKPVSLIKYLVEKSSEKDELILDSFMGSGTTAVACQESNRRFIGFEISEEYCKIARERTQYVRQGLF